jgi:hypothetical protein
VADAFPKATRPVPTTIGRRQIILEQESEGAPVTMHVLLQILDENGQQMNPINKNLEPHLTPQQITTATTFMNNITTKAAEALLP